jgi:hypothetical protein
MMFRVCLKIRDATIWAISLSRENAEPVDLGTAKPSSSDPAKTWAVEQQGSGFDGGFY